MTSYIPVITIDGPSSSGKGTISKLLAEKLHWHLLDSGVMYRILAWLIVRDNLLLNDVSKLVNAVNDLQVEFIDQSDQCQRIIVAKNDVTDVIRQEQYGVIASKVAIIPEVRLAINAYLRSFRKLPGLIADGRDMGTVVFPDARLKVFLTASVEERAQRRFLQLQGKRIDATLSTVLQDLIERDERDQSRIVAPLKPDPTATIIDTTKLSIDEVLQLILAHVKTCFFN